ncbi:MAG: S1C family serine protease [Planctomycetaceae bacterium]
MLKMSWITSIRPELTVNSSGVLRCCVTLLFCIAAARCEAQPLPGEAFEQIVRAGTQPVVKLFGAGVGTLDSYGSAVLISSQGHAVTVWNHLVNTGYLTAVVSDGRRFSVKVLGTSLQHDLAVLKLEGSEDDVFPFVDWKTFAQADAGTPVLAFSNMFHVAAGNEPVSVVHGVVACRTVLNAGLGRWQFPVKSPVYLLDAITNNSGAAGGLLTTLDGQPLGLLGREIRHRETGMWVNYAVPWKTLQPVIAPLLEGRIVQSSDEGDDNRKMVSDLRLTSDFGLTLVPAVLPKTPAYIDRVIPESPAAVAGLLRGDLVLLVNDDVIQSVEDLRASLAAFRKGQTITIVLSRDGSLKTVSLRIP